MTAPLLDAAALADRAELIGYPLPIRRRCDIGQAIEAVPHERRCDDCQHWRARGLISIELLLSGPCRLDRGKRNARWRYEHDVCPRHQAADVGSETQGDAR